MAPRCEMVWAPQCHSNTVVYKAGKMMDLQHESETVLQRLQNIVEKKTPKEEKAIKVKQMDTSGISYKGTN